MNDRDGKTDFADVVRHLRNKNVGVYPSRWTAVLKVLSRLQDGITRLRWRAMERADWHAIVSEQIVEGPQVLRHLRAEDRQILDFGGYESVLPLQLASLGYHVTVLDQRPYPFVHPNLTVRATDLYQSGLSFERFFDVIVSISTIEHLGLGRYGDLTREDGDRAGVDRLWSFLRPGGRLLASVPAGKFTVQRGYRVYDEARLRSVFPQISEIQWYKKENRYGAWLPATSESVADLVYADPSGQLPVEAVAFLVCEKR